MMIFAVVGSSILLIVTAAIARKGTGGAYGTAGLVAFVFSLLCLGHSVLAANSLLICVLGLLSMAWPPKARWFLGGAVLLTMAVYAGFCAQDVPYLLEARRLRLEYPLESLADRLAYERQRSGGAARVARTAELDDEELKWFEDEIGPERHGGMHGAAIDRFDRALTLEEVHSSFVHQFINTPGFGFGRRIRPDRRLIPLEVTPPIALPLRRYEDTTNATLNPDPIPLPRADFAGTPGAQLAYSAREFHRMSYLDFINMVGFGYIVDRDHVAGFQSHQFKEPPTFAAPNEKQQWEIETLDLLSLLKHAEPVAYVSDNLPRMDELRHAPVRPLDDFESKALAGLRSGKELEVNFQPERIRMLGSVRAAKQCLRCHEVERGELLGAFSYRLRVVKQR